MDVRIAVSRCSILWNNYFHFSVLSMREKAISGMMAAVHRRDTDVEEREERISHLKKVIRSQMLSLGVF